MTKTMTSGSSTTLPKLVEIRYGFLAEVCDGETRNFNITASICNGKLDLRVTFRGRDESLEFLPAGVFPVVQEALRLVEARVTPEDLVEHEE